MRLNSGVNGGDNRQRGKAPYSVRFLGVHFELSSLKGVVPRKGCAFSMLSVDETPTSRVSPATPSFKLSTVEPIFPATSKCFMREVFRHQPQL